MLLLYNFSLFGAIAVSYTHLDVYKRQAVYCRWHFSSSYASNRLIVEEEIYKQVAADPRSFISALTARRVNYLEIGTIGNLNLVDTCVPQICAVRDENFIINLSTDQVITFPLPNENLILPISFSICSGLIEW